MWLALSVHRSCSATLSSVPSCSRHAPVDTTLLPPCMHALVDCSSGLSLWSPATTTFKHAGASPAFTSASNVRRRSERSACARFKCTSRRNRFLISRLRRYYRRHSLHIHVHTTHRKVATYDGSMACLQEQVITLAPPFQTVSQQSQRRRTEVVVILSRLASVAYHKSQTRRSKLQQSTASILPAFFQSATLRL